MTTFKRFDARAYAGRQTGTVPEPQRVEAQPGDVSCFSNVSNGAPPFDAAATGPLHAGRLFDELRLRGYALTAEDGGLVVRGEAPLPIELRAAVTATESILIRFAEEFAEQTIGYDYPRSGNCTSCGRFAWRPAGEPATGWRCASCLGTAADK
jgi:hypothetical protein